MMKDESWQTNAKLSTPRPMKSVRGWKLESAMISRSPPSVDSMVSRMGEKTATIMTIIMSNITLIMDVLSRSAMSCLIHRNCR